MMVDVDRAPEPDDLRAHFMRDEWTRTRRATQPADNAHDLAGAITANYRFRGDDVSDQETGQRCTCTLIDPGNYNVEGGNAHPSQWEQNPWCPTHPDVGMIHERLFNLAEDWQGAADADDTHPREARTMAVLAKELHAVLRGNPLEEGAS